MFHAVYIMIENLNVLSRTNDKQKIYKFFQNSKILIDMKKNVDKMYSCSLKLNEKM